MTISENKVVSFHYTLTNDNGDVLDTSDGRDPLAYIQGKGHIISGLEDEMLEKNVGDKFTVTIPPEKAYGLRDDTLIDQVPKNIFEGIDDIQIGMQFQAKTPQGVQLITVVGITDDSVKIDGNHPLAGEQLTFHVEITQVREATPEELEHGHVHTGGHHH